MGEVPPPSQRSLKKHPQKQVEVENPPHLDHTLMTLKVKEEVELKNFDFVLRPPWPRGFLARRK